MSFNYNPTKCNHYVKRFHFILFSFYIYPFLPQHIFVHRLHDWMWRGQKKMLDLLELDYSSLQAVVDSVSAT